MQTLRNSPFWVYRGCRAGFKRHNNCRTVLSAHSSALPSAILAGELTPRAGEWCIWMPCGWREYTCRKCHYQWFTQGPVQLHTLAGKPFCVFMQPRQGKAIWIWVILQGHLSLSYLAGSNTDGCIFPACSTWSAMSLGGQTKEVVVLLRECWNRQARLFSINRKQGTQQPVLTSSPDLMNSVHIGPLWHFSALLFLPSCSCVLKGKISK